MTTSNIEKGIPRYELRMPNNPFIVQDEMIKFCPMTDEDRPRNTWIDKQMRFLEKMGKRMAKWERKKEIAGRPNFEHVLDAEDTACKNNMPNYLRAKGALRRAGKRLHTPFNFGGSILVSDMMNEDH